LCHAGRTSHGRVTQTKRPLENPARFSEPHLGVDEGLRCPAFYSSLELFGVPMDLAVNLHRLWINKRLGRCSGCTSSKAIFTVALQRLQSNLSFRGSTPPP
ncbi:hypothetical protein, partial [Mesorhizobium tianshanense]|uniref:hypothetical protein n=1 Tax=Mesorhizobium tianshanense TaxID=39844 RepID=UPI0024E14948